MSQGKSTGPLLQRHSLKRFPNYFVFTKIAFSVKNGPFRRICHIDSAKYRAFSQGRCNNGFKASLFRQKMRKFPFCNKSKMPQFSRIKKMRCFKRATFCIIQRKVKCRCVLLKKIFNFNRVGC